jgi:hypothetical protein
MSIYASSDQALRPGFGGPDLAPKGLMKLA